MIKISFLEAEGSLDHLIEEAAAGQDVVITGPGDAEVRLVPLSREQHTGVGAEPSRQVGSALDRFIGTWSAEQEAELLHAIEVFERVEQDFWA